MSTLYWLNKSERDKISRTHKVLRRLRHLLQRPTCTATQDCTASPTMQRLLIRPFLSDENPHNQQFLTSNSSAILGPSRKSLVLRQSTGPKLAATTQTHHCNPLLRPKRHKVSLSAQQQRLPLWIQGHIAHIWRFHWCVCVVSHIAFG